MWFTAPCFTTAETEAFLDIQVHGLQELNGLYFDATVRHPKEERYSPALCATNDGIALQRGAAEKQARYPPNPAGRVITLGAETWGRLAEGAEHILAICAATAARRDQRRGRLASAARLSRWRAALDGALQQAVVTQGLRAASGTHGRVHQQRRRQLDLTSLELAAPPGAGLRSVRHVSR